MPNLLPLLFAPLFVIWTNWSRLNRLKTQIGLSEDLFASKNLLLKIAAYLLYCTKCASFQITLQLVFWTTFDAWIAISWAAIISLLASEIELTWYRLR